MIKLGFVSAILADLPFEEVVAVASENRFACIEVEDRAYEGSPAIIKGSLIQSRNYLQQFMIV